MKRFFLVLTAVLVLSGAASAQAHSNTLNWATSTSTGATYNVYKQPACTGVFSKLNTSTITALTFVDAGILADGEINCYYVSAQTALLAESTQGDSQIIRCVTPSVTPPVNTARAVPPAVSETSK